MDNNAITICAATVTRASPGFATSSATAVNVATSPAEGYVYDVYNGTNGTVFVNPGISTATASTIGSYPIPTLTRRLIQVNQTVTHFASKAAASVAGSLYFTPVRGGV